MRQPARTSNSQPSHEQHPAFHSGLIGHADALVALFRKTGYDWRYDQAKPVFFGHYWLRGQLELLAKNIACLGYSVAKEACFALTAGIARPY